VTPQAIHSGRVAHLDLFAQQLQPLPGSLGVGPAPPKAGCRAAWACCSSTSQKRQCGVASGGGTLKSHKTEHGGTEGEKYAVNKSGGACPPGQPGCQHGNDACQSEP
jgi:hypothetical protein